MSVLKLILLPVRRDRASATVERERERERERWIILSERERERKRDESFTIFLFLSLNMTIKYNKTQPAFRQRTCGRTDRVKFNDCQMVQYDFTKVYVRENNTMCLWKTNASDNGLFQRWLGSQGQIFWY